jgi:hypothetical protein
MTHDTALTIVMTHDISRWDADAQILLGLMIVFMLLAGKLLTSPVETRRRGR